MKENFGILPDGTQASLYTICGGGLTATVTDYGAHLVSLFVPDRNGHIDDVVLGYDDANGYRTGNGAYLGATVGRNANRVKNATIGAMLFGLEDFDNMAVSFAQSAFGGFNPLDLHTPAANVPAEECAAFIAENLTEEKLAMSVILPEGVSV